MFSANGGDAKAWPSLGGLPVLSPCLLFSLQPRSFLSPPEKGNHSLGSSTMERALCLLSVPSSWEQLEGEASAHHIWLTKPHRVKAAARAWGSAPPSRVLGTEANPC